jgi:hypothetical protein
MTKSDSNYNQRNVSMSTDANRDTDLSNDFDNRLRITGYYQPSKDSSLLSYPPDNDFIYNSNNGGQSSARMNGENHDPSNISNHDHIRNIYLTKPRTSLTRPVPGNLINPSRDFLAHKSADPASRSSQNNAQKYKNPSSIETPI